VNRRDALARYFPAPFVATTLLLVILILLTPVLVPNGQPAGGTIFTQADLTLDRTPVSNVTSFYLHSPETSVRYALIDVRAATQFNWTGGFPSGPLNWTTVVDQPDLLAFQFNSTANPIALNITILYSYAGGQVYYEGTFAFFVGFPVGTSALTLFSVTTTAGTSLPPGVSTVPVASLPEFGLIVLADVGGSR
jgi:hypothetical protein